MVGDAAKKAIETLEKGVRKKWSSEEEAETIGAVTFLDINNPMKRDRTNTKRYGKDGRQNENLQELLSREYTQHKMENLISVQ